MALLFTGIKISKEFKGSKSELEEYAKAICYGFGSRKTL
jgi:hypothetical protein